MGRRDSIVTSSKKVPPPHKKAPLRLKITISNTRQILPQRKVTASTTASSSSSDDDEDENNNNNERQFIQQSSSAGNSWKVEDYYELQHLLGAGAFGKVYQAIRKSDQKIVALKVIPSYLTTRDAMEREIQALKVFSNPGHDHVCLLYDQHVDDDNSTMYLVMEHTFGGELFEYLVRTGSPFSEQDAAKFLKEFATGLAYIHSKGYAHGDLKPENLMMSSDSPQNPRVKIVDFGFSVPVQNHKIVFGTIAYLAPEILQNFGRPQQPTAAADMFAVGVIMYTMLTGTHPFDRSNQATDEVIMESIIASMYDPEYLSKHVFDDRTKNVLSQSAIDLLYHLLQPNPRKRMSSSTELQHHSWITGHTATPHVLSESDCKLKRFWQKRFRMAVMEKFHIGMLTTDEKLRTIFYDTMDLNGDGHVSFEEFQIALRDIFGDKDDILQEIFQSVDIKENGVLDFDEFESIMKNQFLTLPAAATATTTSSSRMDSTTVTAADSVVTPFLLGKMMNHRRASQTTTTLLSRTELKRIFQSLDANQNGTVEISELLSALHDNHGLDTGAISEWADRADRNYNGRIEFEEFCNVLGGVGGGGCG
eukprot:scaffold2923_cov121-Cylindrotheca_fusiformis.AAC.15